MNAVGASFAYSRQVQNRVHGHNTILCLLLQYIRSKEKQAHCACFSFLVAGPGIEPGPGGYACHLQLSLRLYKNLWSGLYLHHYHFDSRCLPASLYTFRAPLLIFNVKNQKRRSAWLGIAISRIARKVSPNLTSNLSDCFQPERPNRASRGTSPPPRYDGNSITKTPATQERCRSAAVLYRFKFFEDVLVAGDGVLRGALRQHEIRALVRDRVADFVRFPRILDAAE